MKMTVSKPVLTLTKEEFKTIKNFLNLMIDTTELAPYSWEELCCDFLTHLYGEKYHTGSYYDIKIIE